jgi:hypothetical protein
MMLLILIHGEVMQTGGPANGLKCFSMEQGVVRYVMKCLYEERGTTAVWKKKRKA